MQKIRPGTLAALLLGSILTPSPLLAASSIDAIRAAALTDTVAMDFTEGLTTEVGPRPAGTPQEARARDWTVAKLKSLGFSNVRAEPYTMPVWLRGHDEARVIAPFPHNLVRSEEHTSELPSLMRISYAVFCLYIKKTK